VEAEGEAAVSERDRLKMMIAALRISEKLSIAKLILHS
jgi:hypothetical protein